MKRILSLCMAVVLCLTVLAVGVHAEDLPNILETNRKISDDQLSGFSYDPETQYTPGYVLHYMDFSQIQNWEDTGYFIPNDGQFTGFVLEDGILKTTCVDKNMILLTGNNIPQNIQDFTFTIRYRLIGETSRYSGPIYAGLEPGTWNSVGMVGSVVRTNGAIDKASYDKSQEASHKIVYDAMTQGEWVTATASASGGIVNTILVECGGDSVLWTMTTPTIVPDDSYFGIRLSDNCHAEFAEVRVVAGSADSYDALIWPGKEGELVQNVTETALLGYKAPETTAPVTTAAPAVTTVPAETVPAAAPPVQAPVTADPAVLMGIVCSAAVCGAVVFRRRRETI